MSARRAVFFDRDGTLNEAAVVAGKPYPPASVTETRLLAGAADCVSAVKRMGFLAVIVTNQPDAATGKTPRETIEAINAYVAATCGIEEIRVCWHVDADGCDCRKPKPGLLRAAARDLGLDLSRCVMVGDRWRDVEAGRAAGCTTILIGPGYAERSAEPDHRAETLAGVARIVARLA
ncbi:MAG: HAD-IIIA family hydrolase [Magnetospirillum sp.]|nr:HAD-IIIA family hydrolase [Magnetospirillum sp.]